MTLAVFFAALFVGTCARVQTVAVPIRQPTGLDPLSLLAETDFCAGLGTGDSRLLHQIVVSLDSRLSENDTDVALAFDESSTLGQPLPLVCALRLSEKSLLASRRAGVLVRAQTRPMLSNGCAAHGRRSMHGAASGPCDAQLNIGATSSLWENFSALELSHNRLMLRTRANSTLATDSDGHSHANSATYECSGAPAHMCAVPARIQLRSDDIVAELGGPIAVDFDVGSTFHTIDGATENLRSLFAGNPDATLDIILGAQEDAPRISVALRVPTEWISESTIEQLDDDDDALQFGEIIGDSTRDQFTESVRFASEGVGGPIRITLGTLILRSYALRFACSESGDSPARIARMSFEPHEGRANLEVNEAAWFVLAVTVFVASLCHSAEVSGATVAAAVLRIACEPASSRKTGPGWVPRFVLAAAALCVAVAAVTVVEMRAANGTSHLRTATYTQLALALVLVVSVPVLRKSWQGDSLLFLGRAELSVSLAAEMVSLSLLVLLSAIWHEGEHLESVGAAMIGAVIVANYSRHLHHLLDFWVIGGRVYRGPVLFFDSFVLCVAVHGSYTVFSETLSCTTRHDAVSFLIVSMAAVVGGCVSRTYRDAAFVRAVLSPHTVDCKLNVPV